MILSKIAIIIFSCTIIYHFCVWMYGTKPTTQAESMPFNKYDDDYVNLQGQISNATTNFQLTQITKGIIKFQKEYDVKNDVGVQMDVSRLISHLEFKQENINNHTLEYNI